MRSVIIIITAAIITTGILACQKGNNDQHIYFEHYYINYAWGKQYIHWIIDDEGNVRVGRNSDSVLWIQANNLDKAVNSFDSVIFKVERSELMRYVHLIPSAASGQIICEDRNRADFGGTVFNCFSGDRIVLLSSMSDNEDCLNTSTAAIEIDEWLKGIHARIYARND
jgi:hypothetical protein